jgi:ABC-type transport system involved in multi-copper enzyme maturation permease subunit
MIRVVFGIMVGIPFVVFAALTLRPPGRHRPGIRLILLSGTLMFAALLVQVAFPFGAELHTARVASLTATGLLLLASLVCSQAGVSSNFRQARQTARVASAQSGDSGFGRHSASARPRSDRRDS